MLKLTKGADPSYSRVKYVWCLKAWPTRNYLNMNLSWKWLHDSILVSNIIVLKCHDFLFFYGTVSLLVAWLIHVNYLTLFEYYAFSNFLFRKKWFVSAWRSGFNSSVLHDTWLLQHRSMCCRKRCLLQTYIGFKTFITCLEHLRIN